MLNMKYFKSSYNGSLYFGIVNSLLPRQVFSFNYYQEKLVLANSDNEIVIGSLIANAAVEISEKQYLKLKGLYGRVFHHFQ
jgi:hypothetical protein